MKILTYSVLFLSFYGCSQPKQATLVEKSIENKFEDNKKFGDELIKNDFLKFSNPKKIDSLKHNITESFHIYNDENYKFLHIDAEELSEFSFDFFLPQLNKILEKRNIILDVKPTHDYEKTFNIIINGEQIKLYTAEELNNYKFWDSAPRNFFRKINSILKDKDSDEKFYLLYTGNDLSTLLLTEKQFEIIKKYYKNDSKEIPYLP